jgi:hypothetical protein
MYEQLILKGMVRGWSVSAATIALIIPSLPGTRCILDRDPLCAVTELFLDSAVGLNGVPTIIMKIKEAMSTSRRSPCTVKFPLSGQLDLEIGPLLSKEADIGLLESDEGEPLTQQIRPRLNQPPRFPPLNTGAATEVRMSTFPLQDSEFLQWFHLANSVLTTQKPLVCHKRGM